MRALRWAAWIVAVVLVAALVIVMIGWFLPVEHRAARSAVIPAPPSQVYALIADVERYPAWRSNVTAVEVVSRDPDLQFREIGAGDTLLFVVDSAVRDQRLVTRIDDPSLPFGGRWVFTVGPAGGDSTRTELEIVEEGEVHHPLFRFVSRFVIGHSSGVERYLEDVQAWFASA